MARASPRARQGDLALRRRRPTEDLARAISRLPPSASPTHRQTLEDLQSALDRVRPAQYGREAAADRSALDAALDRAHWRATKRLQIPADVAETAGPRVWRPRQTVVEHRA